MIEERQNSVVVQSVQSFVHATGLKEDIRENDAVVFEMRQGIQEYFFHTDDQGNVLALSGATGGVVERYDYDDYGAVSFLTSDGYPTSATSSTVVNPYCWHGLRFDDEIGLINDDGSGYFEPQTGRWVARGYTATTSSDTHLSADRCNPWSHEVCDGPDDDDSDAVEVTLTNSVGTSAAGTGGR